MNVVAIGGSDAGISAALRARELDPSADVTVVVADAYPNFSICGIPYYVSGEVTHWRHLAHRSIADLESAGLDLRLNTTAAAIDVTRRSVVLRGPDGRETELPYDELMVGTGAVPIRPPIDGLAGLGVQDGVHLLHSMGDTFALIESLDRFQPTNALIVGAGYVGLEMAEALTLRGIVVTQVEMLPQVLPTVDPELGRLVHDELVRHGVQVHTRATVTRIAKSATPGTRLQVEGTGHDGRPAAWNVDLVLVVVGVRPDTSLLLNAGAQPGVRGAVVVDTAMRTGLPHVWAAGDCVQTHHRLSTLSGPIVLVAHSYGGAVITNAATGNPNVKALVYVDAFAPAEGEIILPLAGADSALAADPTTVFDFVPYPGAPPGDIDLYLKHNVFLTSFATGVPRPEAELLYASQRPLTLSSGNQPSGSPAWATIPSWYVLGTQDAIITPTAQQFMAERAHAQITRVKAGHLSLITQPQQVTAVIEQAVRATN